MPSRHFAIARLEGMRVQTIGEISCRISPVAERRIIMSEIEQLERTVSKLSPRDLAQFRAWFLEFDARVWDKQIEADLKAGKLDRLIAEARAELEQGKARPL